MKGKSLYSAATIVVCVWTVCSAPGGFAWPGKHDPNPSDVTAIDYAKGAKYLGAYAAPYVPPAKLTNSPRLQELILNGQLKLSMEDAIALALENNLDVAVARYNLPLAQANVLRTKGGAAARSVAGANVSSAQFSGALGSGLGSSGGFGSGGGLAGGGVNSVSPFNCCDPYFTVAYGYGHTINPENISVAAGVPVVKADSSFGYAGLSQGFLTGTSFTAYVYSYGQADNDTTQLFNPYVTSYMSVGVTQNLLSGFGYRANAVFIRQAQNLVTYSKSVFEQNVIAAVDNVMTLYYDLLADQEAIRVAKESLGYAQKLLADNQTEAHIGAAAKLEVVQSEQDVATRQEDILTAENQFSQDEQSMKAAISKNFNSELAAVHIDATDRLPEPHPGDVPPLSDAIQEALKNRAEIQQAQINLRDQEYVIKYDRNLLLPTLNAFATYSPSGLSAAAGPALNQLFRNRYTGYSAGFTLNIPVHNRVAQADAAQALVEQRQLAMKLQQAQNQAVWDVSKAVSAVHQAQGQLDAAINVANLARQSLSMEQTKFKVGQAPASEEIAAQTSLATAEDNVVKDRATYAKALIQFEQATGTILQRNNIFLQNAIEGHVPRPPNIPGTPIGADLQK
jgi:outer membrane protein